MDDLISIESSLDVNIIETDEFTYFLLFWLIDVGAQHLIATN